MDVGELSMSRGRSENQAGKQARKQRQAEPEASSLVGAGVDTAWHLAVPQTTPAPGPSRNSRLPWISLPHWLASRQASLQPPWLPSTQMPPGAPFLLTEGGAKDPEKAARVILFCWILMRLWLCLMTLQNKPNYVFTFWCKQHLAVYAHISVCKLFVVSLLVPHDGCIDCRQKGLFHICFWEPVAP